MLFLGLLALPLVTWAPASATHTPGSTQQSLWPDTAIPANFGKDDLGGDTLGVRFRAARSGTIDGLEYYRPPNDTATHTLSLWTNDGTKLASATVTTSTAGWEHATFSTPVQIRADTLYVASVYSPDGHYSQTASYFTAPYTNGLDLTAAQDTLTTPNGVYTYGAETFPTQTWGSSNYWVDVLFTPGDVDGGGDGGSAVDPSVAGSWKVLPYQTSFVSIHAALMRTEKLLLMGGSENNPDNLAAGRLYAEVWDQALGTLKQVPPTYDLFCSAHAFLPDGRLLIAGGTLAYPEPSYPSGDYYKGSKEAVFFDPSTERFARAPSMASGRWYPTLTALGDGRVHALSGLDENGQVNVVPEVYTPGAGWTARPPVSSSWSLYPHLVLLESGKLFYTGATVDNYNVGVLDAGFLDPNTSEFRPIPGLSHRDRREAASVLLPPAQAQKVMVIGGGDPGVRNVDIVDLKSSSPSYTPGPPLRTGRLHISAVVLPDGKVLATGGGAHGRGHNPVLEADIYDPAANTWTPAANPSVGREYHSTAFLLPDGRVVTAGSQPDYASPGELRIEVYSPPYLFRGARPVISSSPSAVKYGGSFSVKIDGGQKKVGDITALRLVRPMAVTHSLDTEQRVVDLSFTQTKSALNATAPSTGNLAPPGWYMLFAVDKHGVPSVASWVHLT